VPKYSEQLRIVCFWSSGCTFVAHDLICKKTSARPCQSSVIDFNRFFAGLVIGVATWEGTAEKKRKFFVVSDTLCRCTGIIILF